MLVHGLKVAQETPQKKTWWWLLSILITYTHLYAPGGERTLPNSILRGNVALSSDTMYEFYKGSFPCNADVINFIYLFQSFRFILRSEKG